MIDKKWMIGGGAIALVIGGAILIAGSGTASGIPYRDAAAVKAGRALYEENCAACHGAGLEGEADWRTPKPSGRMPAPPHDETGHTWHHPDAQLFAITKLGTAEVVGGGYQSDMIGFGAQLSDYEILSILAYIKSTWPPRVTEMHNARNQN